MTDLGRAWYEALEVTLGEALRTDHRAALKWSIVKTPWEQVPEAVRVAMEAAVQRLVSDGVITEKTAAQPVAQPVMFEDDRLPGEAVDAYSLRKAREARVARETDRGTPTPDEAQADALRKFSNVWSKP